MANICLPPHIHTPKKSNVLYFHDQTPGLVFISSCDHCTYYSVKGQDVADRGVAPAACEAIARDTADLAAWEDN